MMSTDKELYILADPDNVFASEWLTPDQYEIRAEQAKIDSIDQRWIVAPYKTPEELAALKRNWEGDPCWGIEETPFFERYYDELLQFRLACDEECKQRYMQRLEDQAQEIGVEGNTTLARYVLGLEDQIALLQDQVQRLLNSE